MANIGDYEYIKKLLEDRGQNFIDGVITAMTARLADVRVSGSDRVLRDIPLAVHVSQASAVAGRECSVGIHAGQPYIVAVFQASADTDSIYAPKLIELHAPVVTVEAKVDGYHISWTQVASAGDYELFGNDTDTGENPHRAYIGTQLSFIYPYDDQTRYFAVRGRTVTGIEGPLSSWVTDTNPPVDPVLSHAFGTDGHHLSWVHPVISDVRYFEVYRNTTDSLNESEVLVYQGLSLQALAAYSAEGDYFYARAVGWDYSASDGVWTVEQDPTPDVPASAGGVVTSGGSIISWTPPAAGALVKEYVVYSDDNAEGTSQAERWRGSALQSTPVAYTGDEYFWVEAIGYDDTASAQAATGQVDPTPSVPIIAVVAVEGGFQVSWTAETNAAGYTLQWATDDEGADTEVKFTGDALYKFIAADGSHKYFQVKATGYDASDSAYCAWATDDSAPPTPTGFTASDGLGKITVAVALGTDTSHLAVGFRYWELQQSDTGTGEGTNVVDLPALEVSGGVATRDIQLNPGTTKYYRIRAVDWAGNASAYTAWDAATSADPNIVEHPVEDKFDGYGGSTLSPLGSLWWLKIADFDVDENWLPLFGTISNETTITKEGVAKRTTIGPVSGNIYAYLPVTLNLSVEGRFEDNDFVTFSRYVANLGAIPPWQPVLAIAFYDASVDSFDAQEPAGPLGWAEYMVKKSDLVIAGDPDWSHITALEIYYTVEHAGNESLYVVWDDLRIVKADPDDPTTYNDTGTIWDFLPKNGDDAWWHIYPGNRTGEPDKPFSLGQIYTAAVPANWLLAYHTQSYVSKGVGIVGAYLKGVDGAVALAFCIQDPAVATRTCYAIELDTAGNAVNLVRWVSGARTQIATAAFTANPNVVYWIGADWRDLDVPGENRIKVYASTVEGNLIQASNLVISATDGNVTRGSYVGVMSKECNCRFVYVRAGSPEHAMTAEHAFNASHLDISTVDTLPTTGMKEGDQVLLKVAPIFRAQINGAPANGATTVTVDNVTIGAIGSTLVGHHLFLLDANGNRIGEGQISATGSGVTLNVVAQQWATLGWLNDMWVEVGARHSLWHYLEGKWKCTLVDEAEKIGTTDITTNSLVFVATGTQVNAVLPVASDVIVHVDFTPLAAANVGVAVAVYMDGALLGRFGAAYSSGSIVASPASQVIARAVAAGNHLFEIYWRVLNAGTATSNAATTPDYYVRKVSVEVRTI